jgi:hypothetical protein
VTLKIKGQQKGLQHISCGAGESVNVSFSFTPTASEWYDGEISILDHPVIFDDHLYFTLNPVAHYGVLCINGNEPNKYITSLFESDPVYTFTQSGQQQLNYTLFAKQQMIILNNPTNISSGLSLELKKFIEQGGQVVCFPPTDVSVLPSLNQLLNDLSAPNYGPLLKQQIQVNDLNLQDPLFRNVFERVPKNMDLPSVTAFYALQRNHATKGKALMNLANGQPFVWQSAFKKGNLVLLASSTDQTNFAQHAIFVPFMLKLGTGKPQAEQLYYTIGKPEWIPLQHQTSVDKLISMRKGETELALQTAQHDGKTAVYVDYPLEHAGVYTLTPQGTNKPKQLSAMNFNRRESTTAIWPESEMNTFLAKLPHAAKSSDDTSVLQNSIHNQLNGTPFWRYCVWLALVFVLIEILLLRLLKS